jgi:S-DNA-T family DNA segregation ATPase FtsK/SpoIIIE
MNAPERVQPREAAAPTKPQIKISAPTNIPKEMPLRSPVAEKPEKSPAPKQPSVVIPKETAGNYRLPSIELLQDAPALDRSKIQMDLEENSRILEDTLRDFGIEAKVVEVEQGPTITRYELQPAAGVKVQKITSLENDIAMVMSAASVRIIAPIPGKSRVGIEVPPAPRQSGL